MAPTRHATAACGRAEPDDATNCPREPRRAGPTPMSVDRCLPGFFQGQSMTDGATMDTSGNTPPNIGRFPQIRVARRRENAVGWGRFGRNVPRPTRICYCALWQVSVGFLTDLLPAEFDEVAAELGRTLDHVKVPEAREGRSCGSFRRPQGEVTAGYVAAATP